jgi:peptidoglycan/LPS O-acetylase OafA/YrhL
LAVAVPAFAVVAILLIALTTGLPLTRYVISGAAGFVSGGVFAYLATLPRRRRRLIARLLVLTSVLAMVTGFVILSSRIASPSFHDAGASLGRFAF